MADADREGTTVKPVRTAHSNMVYTGPPGVGDLHCQRIQPGHIRSVWQLTAEERAYIAAGGNIELDIFSEPIPPVSLNCSDEDGVGEDAPEVAARIAELKAAQR